MVFSLVAALGAHSINLVSIHYIVSICLKDNSRNKKGKRFRFRKHVNARRVCEWRKCMRILLPNCYNFDDGPLCSINYRTEASNRKRNSGFDCHCFRHSTSSYYFIIHFYNGRNAKSTILCST